MDKLKQVQEYWDSHHLGTQFLNDDDSVEVGSKEYFVQFDRSMERWEYKNRLIDWIASRYQKGMLLEVGSGLGQDLAKFAKRGFSVTGIELARTVADMARKHLGVYNLKGTVLQGNAEALGFLENKFDVAYSCGVLQHTTNMQRAIDEIHRVVRKGGLAVVIVYYRYSWFNLLSKIAKVNVEFEDKDAPIINTYSKKELYHIFSRFKRVEINLEYCYPTPTPRKGLLPSMYNRIFIPILNSIPYFIMKNFGWHIVVKARK